MKASLMTTDRRTFLALAAAASVPALASPALGSHGLRERLEEMVVRGRRRLGLRAVLFGAWQGERAILTGAYGRSAGGQDARVDMHFRAAAITTSYVNALLLRLVERGRLWLDDPLSDWFPNLPHAQKVTLLMLAQNRSGYADYLASKPFVELRPSVILRDWTAAELIRLGTSLPMVFPPGTNFHYSHTNAVLLGEVLQRATAKPIHRLLRRILLEPHRLGATEYPQTRAIRYPRLHAYSAEFGTRKDTTWWDPAWVSHSGLMNTNLHDLGRWARLLGSGAALSDQSQAMLLATDNVGQNGNAPDLYYGMGVIVANGWIVQNGLYFGWNPVMAYLPSRDITVALTTTLGSNAEPDVSNGLRLLKEAVEILAPEQPIPARYVK